ncbi:MAG TPA: exodeoxyribonuclease V subunit gamma [Planctomycetota bacterium]|nr:exodeoxyribonuclease V subunit gamma [Planctomycetota bacterium]
MPSSTLFISTDLATPAAALCASLAREDASCANPFVPANIIVPNASLKSWLNLHLAREQGIAINLRIRYLEKALWEIFAQLGGTQPSAPLRELDHERYRMLIVSVLLDPSAGGSALKPIRDYLAEPDPASRQYCRRVWDVADRIARLIRDYEYHRQDEFIQRWLRDEPALNGADADDRALELCERALFLMVAKPGGLRDTLSKAENAAYKTLPQFANEVIEGGSLRKDIQPQRPVHLFGLSQISTYHVRVLRWLGQHLELRLYHINPLAGCVAEELSRGDKHSALRRVAERVAKEKSVQQVPAQQLLQWADAAAATLWRMSDLTGADRKEPPFAIEVLTSRAAAAKAPDGDCVLRRVQQQTLNLPSSKTRLCQDRSLQVLACPGALREIEAIQQSILHNLRTDPSLKLSDIAVLVTDMNLYRPLIQSVFERRLFNAATGESAPSPIAYTIADYNAAGVSVFGQALLGMLDIGLNAFTRSRVLEVLLNPCFLEKMNVSREEAVTWMDWAERLCVYHGWDREDKREAGFGDSRYYTWKLALQRLRLGRVMEAPDGNPEHPAPVYKDVIPYADLETADSASLNAFCMAVEKLMPRLLEFRSTPASGSEWRRRLQSLMDDFLEIPSELPDEAQVRRAILQGLPNLVVLDAVAQSDSSRKITLPLIREFTLSLLEGIEAGANAFAGSGVVVSALQPARPIPYRIVYIAGLGEGKFPASDVNSPFDLREMHALPGDIRTPEAQRLQFLEALLSVREKLYLLYSCRELQKDQELHPCSLLLKLCRYIKETIIGADFQSVKVPLSPHDPRYLLENAGPEKEYSDALVNYSHADRLLALKECGPASGAAALGLAIRERLLKASTAPAGDPPASLRVSVKELAGFLKNPAEAALKRHLRLYDEYEKEDREDEPFYTDEDATRTLAQDTLTRIVASAAKNPKTLETWKNDVERQYSERVLSGDAPDAEFATADLGRLKRLVKTRLDAGHGAGSLAKFVDDLSSAVFCGPVQIGHSHQPRGATLRFPALSLRNNALVPPADRDILVSGTCDLVWQSAEAIHIALILHNKTTEDVGKDVLTHYLIEPVLFYLALLAGELDNPDGHSSRTWIGSRPLHLTIALEDGFAKFTYSVSPAEAREYLSYLTNEFLKFAQLQTLPYFTIAKNEQLRGAFEYADDDPRLPQLRDDYPQLLQDALYEDEESAIPGDTRLRVTDLLSADIPADAFEIVRRRFRLLDRGPAQNRAGGAQSEGGDTVAAGTSPSPKTTDGSTKSARRKKK